jgi:hypothetical protein
VEISQIALQGLEQAQSNFDQAAGRLTSLGNGSPETTPVDTVDLSQTVVALLSAKNAVSANISVMKVANQMQGQLVNLLG